jgi:hypothetical protein
MVRLIFRDALAGVGQLRIAWALNAERAPVFRNDGTTEAYWHRNVIGTLACSGDDGRSAPPAIREPSHDRGASRLATWTPPPTTTSGLLPLTPAPVDRRRNV